MTGYEDYEGRLKNGANMFLCRLYFEDIKYGTRKSSAKKVCMRPSCGGGVSLNLNPLRLLTSEAKL